MRCAPPDCSSPTPAKFECIVLNPASYNDILLCQPVASAVLPARCAHMCGLGPRCHFYPSDKKNLELGKDPNFNQASRPKEIN